MKVIIDGSMISDRLQLHSHIAETLDFPETYGKNLDALYDCLTDIHTETEIVIVNYEQLYQNLGKYADSLKKVIIQANQENSFIRFSGDV